MNSFCTSIWASLSGRNSSHSFTTGLRPTAFSKRFSHANSKPLRAIPSSFLPQIRRGKSSLYSTTSSCSKNSLGDRSRSTTSASLPGERVPRSVLLARYATNSERNAQTLSHALMPFLLLLVLAAAVGCGRMTRRQPGLAENLLPQRPWRIFPLHEAACLQHRDHPIDKIYKRPWCHGVHQVKAIDAGLKPLLERIGDLLRCAGHKLARQPRAHQVTEGHRFVRGRGDQIGNGTAHGVKGKRCQRAVQVDGPQVHANAPAEMRQGPLGAELFEIGSFFRLGFCLGASDDGGEPLKEADILGVASQADSLGANVVNNTRRPAQTVARGDDEDTFRMLGRKGPAPRR